MRLGDKFMKKNVLIHVPHSSIYIPDDYKNSSLISLASLEEENIFMCDFRVADLLENQSQAIIFPFSRLYCDVERFRDESEAMNKYGMGYIYTKTSKGEEMFNPDIEHRKEVDTIYDDHHKKLDDMVTGILDRYGNCIIIDLHSFSDE